MTDITIRPLDNERGFVFESDGKIAVALGSRTVVCTQRRAYAPGVIDTMRNQTMNWVPSDDIDFESFPPLVKTARELRLRDAAHGLLNALREQQIGLILATHVAELRLASRHEPTAPATSPESQPDTAQPAAGQAQAVA